jgi:hypothetical protein
MELELEPKWTKELELEPKKWTTELELEPKWTMELELEPEVDYGTGIRTKVA